MLNLLMPVVRYNYHGFDCTLRLIIVFVYFVCEVLGRGYNTGIHIFMILNVIHGIIASNIPNCVIATRNFNIKKIMLL